MKKLIVVLVLFLPLALLFMLQNNQPPALAEAETITGEANNNAYLPIIANNASYIKWAFEETFDGDPASPSQDLLPDNFDFVATHRTHQKEHFRVFESYPADHDVNCNGPDPNASPLPQHSVVTSHKSNGTNPDKSFYICKNHMMSSMGDVDGYSVTSFWPKQEFDFSSGGYLEFDVSINADHPRSWFEVMITPRSELKVAAAPWWLPIDEAYPKDRIAFSFDRQTREIQVGTGAIDPEGLTAYGKQWWDWPERYPNDPANYDRRIRRTMRIHLTEHKITWSIEKADGSFDAYAIDVPDGLPFSRGLVVFKTHAYTPEKDRNMNIYTFHWDNIRFSGPVVGRYENFEATDVVYLQGNGDRPVGQTKTVTIDLPHVGPNPVLFGQVHTPMSGQVLLSINGRSNIPVHPYDYNPGTCSSTGWKSFQVQVDPSWLKTGSNTFKWTIGPKPNCAEDWLWNGFSIKDLEIQFDLN